MCSALISIHSHPFQYLMYLILLNVRQIASILFSDLFKYLQNVLINEKEKFSLFFYVYIVCVCVYVLPQLDEWCEAMMELMLCAHKNIIYV